MRVLVTGWAGYLGPHVVRLLKEHGHYVIGLDVGWYLASLAELPVWPDEAYFTDIRDGRPDATPHVVVHLAGLSNDPLGDLEPMLTYEINQKGTLDLIDQYRFASHVVASSCSVYGTAEMADEETPPAPLTRYAKHKAEVDAHLPASAVSLRFGTLYGYSPGHRLDLACNRMVYDATRARGVTVYGNAARPLTHVEDAARAIVQAVESPLMRGIYNCGGENWRMQDLGSVVRFAVARRFSLPSNAVSLVYKPAGADARDYSASSEKLLATGFRFEHTVEEELPALIDKTVELRGPLDRYVRLSTIRGLIDSGRLTADLKEKVA